VDFTAKGGSINPKIKDLTKDVFDTNFWGSKQINSVVMPWIPFFSNCDGFGSHIVLYEAFEYHEQCSLPSFEDIKIVNPIPSSGMDPIADVCNINITCRYDEPIGYSTSSSEPWFNIIEDKELFYVTRNPVTVNEFNRTTGSEIQTWYTRLIRDGSDELIPVKIIPEIKKGKRPQLVEANFYYYQKSKKIKLITQVEIRLKNYADYREQVNETTGEKYFISEDFEYNLQLNFEPLSYFNLINSFQFSLPIYILLFSLVSLVLILGIVVFWLLNIQCSQYKRPPSIRFFHMAKVTFRPPAIGTTLASVPVGIVAGLLKIMQESDLFIDTRANWSELGSTTTTVQEIVAQQRGRLGNSLLHNRVCVPDIRLPQHHLRALEVGGGDDPRTEERHEAARAAGAE